MFTIKLVSNTSDEVTYNVLNGDTKDLLNKLTVNKHDYSYSLSNGKSISNHYESAAYRAIVAAIKNNAYPQEYSNGWG